MHVGTWLIFFAKIALPRVGRYFAKLLAGVLISMPSSTKPGDFFEVDLPDALELRLTLPTGEHISVTSLMCKRLED